MVPLGCCSGTSRTRPKANSPSLSPTLLPRPRRLLFLSSPSSRGATFQKKSSRLENFPFSLSFPWPPHLISHQVLQFHQCLLNFFHPYFDCPIPGSQHLSPGPLHCCQDGFSKRNFWSCSSPAPLIRDSPITHLSYRVTFAFLTWPASPPDLTPTSLGLRLTLQQPWNLPSSPNPSTASVLFSCWPLSLNVLFMQQL